MGFSQLANDIGEMMMLVWALAMSGLLLEIIRALVETFYRSLSQVSFLQEDERRSFGSPTGIGDTIDYHLTNLWLLVNPQLDRRGDLLTTRLSCRTAGELTSRFGLSPSEYPLTTRATHGIVVLSSFVVLEVSLFAAITGGGLVLYGFGVEIDLVQMYEASVAFLLLITFSTLFEANRRLPELESPLELR